MISLMAARESSTAADQRIRSTLESLTRNPQKKRAANKLTSPLSPAFLRFTQPPAFPPKASSVHHRLKALSNTARSTITGRHVWDRARFIHSSTADGRPQGDSFFRSLYLSLTSKSTQTATSSIQRSPSLVSSAWNIDKAERNHLGDPTAGSIFAEVEVVFERL